ncbi:MAG: Smg protein [Methylophagaceae bacterium]|jgi:Smg protein
MKEDVFDVLLYLFENYIDTDDSNKPDKDALETELEGVGFLHLEIHKAFEWLESMTVIEEKSSKEDRHKAELAMRFYTEQELLRLDMQCRGYLLFLEQVGVLDGETREVVIERVMALDTDEIDLDQMKWVVLMVLFYQPGREIAYAWMEDLVFEDLEAVVH